MQDTPGTTSQRALHRAFARRFDLVHWGLNDAVPLSVRELPEYDGFDAFVWHVAARKLWKRPPFDWSDFAGARIQYEEDALRDFSPIVGRRFQPRAAPIFRAFGFHAMVSTGKRVAEFLREQNVHALWIPKGYDVDLIGNDNRDDRAGFCSYGATYLARVAMLKRVAHAGYPVETFRCAPEKLSEHLNRFLACLVCNMVLRGSQVLPSLLLRGLPLALRQGVPGMEPMIKNFEVAGAGCAPFCDRIPELDDLGFEDGRSMIAYGSFDELLEKLHHYSGRLDELRSIGQRAAGLARTRHTWDHRAGAFESLITSEAYLPA